MSEKIAVVGNRKGADMQLCKCHGEPMYWKKRSKHPAGGFWTCSVKAKEIVRAWRAANKEKRREYDRRWRLENPEKHVEQRRRYALGRFGLTQSDYDEMLTAQGGTCAICRRACKTGNNLAVDHDHKTGRVRGLLCSTCNTAIGKLGDSHELVMAAAAYLKGRNA